MQPRPPGIPANMLPNVLKDALLTALVAAALGFFIVGFRTADAGMGKGLGFDYHLVKPVTAAKLRDALDAVMALRC